MATSTVRCSGGHVGEWLRGRGLLHRVLSSFNSVYGATSVNFVEDVYARRQEVNLTIILPPQSESAAFPESLRVMAMAAGEAAKAGDVAAFFALIDMALECRDEMEALTTGSASSR